MFDESGYTGTTLAAIAERAGVNARTMYKVFGSKVRLLSRLVDVAMVGDQDAVAVSDREWAIEAFDAPSGRRRTRAFAAVVRRLMDSAGTAFRIAAEAAAADHDARELWATGQRHRREDASRYVEALEAARMLRDDCDHDQAVATVWLLSSPETHTQLTRGFGWTADRYERWLEQTLADALLALPSD